VAASGVGGGREREGVFRLRGVGAGVRAARPSDGGGVHVLRAGADEDEAVGKEPDNEVRRAGCGGGAARVAVARAVGRAAACGDGAGCREPGRPGADARPPGGGRQARRRNRREVGAYCGLVPTQSESGETTDRKGHITHQGPPRIRRVLCQATHVWVRFDPAARATYEWLLSRNPKKRKKIAIVAMMRRLAIRLWHLAKGAGIPEDSPTATASSGVPRQP